MRHPPESVDPVQLGAYFALIEVTSLLRHAIEQQLREAGDLSFVQFQILSRLDLHSSTGSHRMTDLADAIVYSRSALTYQAGLLEKTGLVTRTPTAGDERGITVTITDAGRALLAKVMPGHTQVVSNLLFEPLSRASPPQRRSAEQPVGSARDLDHPPTGLSRRLLDRSARSRASSR